MIIPLPINYNQMSGLYFGKECLNQIKKLRWIWWEIRHKNRMQNIFNEALLNTVLAANLIKMFGLLTNDQVQLYSILCQSLIDKWLLCYQICHTICNWTHLWKVTTLHTRAILLFSTYHTYHKIKENYLINVFIASNLHGKYTSLKFAIN